MTEARPTERSASPRAHASTTTAVEARYLPSQRVDHRAATDACLQRADSAHAVGGRSAAGGDEAVALDAAGGNRKHASYKHQIDTRNGGSRVVAPHAEEPRSQGRGSDR